MEPLPASDVVFVSMPFGPIRLPSLGLSLLRAALARTGIASRIAYCNLDFAALVGTRVYEEIAESAPELLVGEWIFAPAAFDSAGDDAAFRELMRARQAVTLKDAPGFWDGVEAARRAAPAFLDACARDVLAANPRIVGFTSTFQQNVASLALARRIKAARPDVMVIVGGANCEGPMGRALKRSCAFVDGVFSGEADRAIGPIVAAALRDGRLPDDVPGLFTAVSAAGDAWQPGEPVDQMDDLPFPEYGDFFARYDDCVPAGERRARVTFETSRGCWWGQKHHCTFCGLNGGTMAFRSKSPRRALDEIDHLMTAYPGTGISVVDNILDMRYFANVIPELAKRETKPDLFYETKANLRKDHVRMLREAGVSAIQPGIESLSTAVLARMNKGISMLQNVQLLKWCKEYALDPNWNVLWGFGGEDPADYAAVTAIMPLLTHLKPPMSCARIRLDRFSPNFEDPAGHGFSNVRAYPSYAHVYPFAPETLHDLAYYFTHEYADGRTDFAYAEPLGAGVKRWQDAYAASDLFWLEVHGKLLVCDARPDLDAPLVRILTGLERTVFECCDGIRTLREIGDHVAQAYAPEAIAEGAVLAAIERLAAEGLLLREGNNCLTLAIPIGVYGPRKDLVGTFMARVRERLLAGAAA